MNRKEVLVMDVIVAITLLESSLDQSNLLTSLNILHTSFSNTPEKEYLNQASMILKKLNLEEFINDEFEELNISIDNFDASSENNYYSTSQSQSVISQNEIKSSTIQSLRSLSQNNFTNNIKMNDLVDKQISQMIDELPEEKPNTQIVSQKLSYSNKRKLIEELSSNFSQTKKAKPDNQTDEITNSQFSTTQSKPSFTQKSQSKKKDDYELTEQDLDF